MRISYFKEFIVLAKYLNFSIASERLNMTQPGLSRHISALENEIGIKLLNRDTHSVKLTEKGTLFLKGIQKIVADYDLLCEQLSKITLTRLSIGIPYFGVYQYLSFVINDFETTYPDVKLSYLAVYPDEIIDGLLSKKVDIAIFPKVDFMHSDRMTFHQAFKETLVLALNRNHPLAGKKSLHIGDLENEHFISIKGNYGDALFEYEYDFCRAHGFEPKVMMATETVEAAALKMKAESGVMMLPYHFKGANISCDVMCVDIVDKDCFLDVSLVHLSDNQNPAVHKFIAFYLQLLEKSQPKS